MGFADTGTLHRVILIPSMALAFLATPLVTLLPGFTLSYIIWYLASATFLSAHWWSLASAIDSLFKDENTLAAVKFVIAAFPALLLLSLIYVAARTNRAFLTPTAAGITVLVAAVSISCTVWGITGLARPEKERIDA